MITHFFTLARILTHAIPALADDEHPGRNPCQPISSAATVRAGISPASLLARAGPGGSASRAFPLVPINTGGIVSTVNMSVALRRGRFQVRLR